MATDTDTLDFIGDNEDQNASPGKEAGDDSGKSADVQGTVEEPELDDDDGDDLFGDGDDDDAQPESLRKLDDAELDSGDDEGRTDRVPEVEETVEETEGQTLTVMDADIARHPIPEPSDGELYRLKVPSFMSLEPTAFDPKTFQPPTAGHHSKEGTDDDFSAYDTAMTTIRWRRSPNNPKELQSNARILRWADGSLTLQLASQPLIQYQINARALVPPQVKPKKPTPTSTMHRSGAQPKESYTYLAAAYSQAEVVRITNKFTTALDVVPPRSARDSAVEKLQNAFARKQNQHSPVEQADLYTVGEDPEIARQKAEAAFKMKQRLLRTKERQEQRLRDKEQTRRNPRSSGLSVGGLEDDEGGRRGARKAGGRPKTGLRRDWSDDEDYGLRGKTREDVYDEEDDFIAASDEELEIDDDEEDEEDILDSPPRRGQETQSPKRGRGEEEEVVVSRFKRRRVVEDDDEDE